MGRIKDRIRVSERVKALELLVSDLFARFWGSINSFCSLVRLAGGLLQGLY